MTTPGAALVQLESFPVHLAHGHEGDLHAWPHQLQVGHLVTAAQDLKTQLDTLQYSSQRSKNRQSWTPCFRFKQNFYTFHFQFSKRIQKEHSPQTHSITNFPKLYSHYLQPRRPPNSYSYACCGIPSHLTFPSTESRAWQ